LCASDLNDRYNEELIRIVATLDFVDPLYLEAEQALIAQRKLIQTKLLDISNDYLGVYPEFNAEALRSDDADIFVFYKPVLYQEEQNPDIFKGVVRLAVSVGDIKGILAQVQRQIIFITLGASAAALAIGVVVALLISMLMLRPIRALVSGVGSITDNPDMASHKGFNIDMKTGDELELLADTINDMVTGLVLAAEAREELVMGQVIQKAFIPLGDIMAKDGDMTVRKDAKRDLSTGWAKNAFFSLYGYYEGADEVSGDYFDFFELDENHYAIIKCDISGHGLTAGLIMVQVASLFKDYFRKVVARSIKTGKLEYDLRDFTIGVNDLIAEIGFDGRFAAFNLLVMDVRTAEYRMIHAGDNIVNIFDGQTHKMKQLNMEIVAAAGANTMKGWMDLFGLAPNYKEVKGQLNRGDILMLFTDGVEESHHLFRTENLNVVEYQDLPDSVKEADQEFLDAGYKEIDLDRKFELFDTVRIDDVLNAALNGQTYQLLRRCDITIARPLHFDFAGLAANSENAVLALASVEKAFRLVPDRHAGSKDIVHMDRNIADFMKLYFREYEEFFGNPLIEDQGENDSLHVRFSHLKEDKQEDDLTIWAYQRL
jgi:hypothetical protein